MFYLNKIFKPSKNFNLQRIGGKNDGGYLLNFEDIEKAKNFYSFGIGLNWEFENEIYNIKKKNRETFEIHMFDHTINKYFWFKTFVINFLELIRLKKKIFFFIAQFFSLKKFINKKECFFYNYMISPTNLEHASIYKLKTIDLKKILEKKEKKRENFFKIDIEGSEYRILDQLISNQEYINGCIIEFHDIDIHEEKIQKFLEKFNLNLVHCHVNNCGPIKDDKYPTQVELTFSYDLNSLKSKEDINIEFPHPFDAPNHPRLRDDKISFV